MITLRTTDSVTKRSNIFTLDIELAHAGLGLWLVCIAWLLRPIGKCNTLLDGNMVVIWRHSNSFDIPSIPFRLIWMSLDGPGHLDDLPGNIMHNVLPSGGAHTQEDAMMKPMFVINGLFGSHLIAALLGKTNELPSEGSEPDRFIWRFAVVSSSSPSKYGSRMRYKPRHNREAWWNAFANAPFQAQLQGPKQPIGP
jgi:hypothetical protein